MLETISIVLGAYGLISFFRTFGLFVGIGLIVLWIVRIKNTVALFYDKSKIRATLLFGVPGLLCILLWAIFRFAWAPGYDDYSPSYSYSNDYVEKEYIPTLALVHIVNKSDKAGRIEYGETEMTIQPGDWHKIEIETKNTEDTIRGWLGDSLVFDTVIAKGSYIANFSDDITAIAEEVIYTTSSYTSTDDLEYIMLTEPGIRQFSPSLERDVYNYDITAPQTISMPAYSSNVRKWDLSLATGDELMEMLLKALKEEGGDVDLGDLEDSEEE